MNNSRSLVETISGKRIDVQNVSLAQVCIKDIAYHLARINRFAGASTITINDAAHSIFVMELVLNHTGNKVLALHALLHDASEYVFGDIIRPVKNLPGMEEVLKKYTEPFHHHIIKTLGIPEISNEEHTIIKDADMAALSIEAHFFMKSRGYDWGLRKYDYMIESLPREKTAVYKYSPEQAEIAFLVQYAFLKNKINN